MHPKKHIINQHRIFWQGPLYELSVISASYTDRASFEMVSSASHSPKRNSFIWLVIGSIGSCFYFIQGVHVGGKPTQAIFNHQSISAKIKWRKYRWTSSTSFKPLIFLSKLFKTLWKYTGLIETAFAAEIKLSCCGNSGKYVDICPRIPYKILTTKYRKVCAQVLEAIPILRSTCTLESQGSVDHDVDQRIDFFWGKS